jgi:pimeloyl-ACP methyl ester carboxylesterase
VKSIISHLVHGIWNFSTSPAYAFGMGATRLRMRKPLPRWTGRILVSLVALVVVLAAAGASYQLIATARDARRYPPPGKLVDIGGYRLHLHCTGEGSPTVVVEAGGGSFSLDWSLVQPEVAKFTRICTYDRSGFGWSDAGPKRGSAQRAVSELRALLLKAGIESPYVLVGHSLGGIYALRFAGQNRQEIAGLVLIDSGHEELWSKLPEQFHRKWDRQISVIRVLATFSRLGIVRLVSARSRPQALPGLPSQTQSIRAALTQQSRYFDAALSELKSVRDGGATIGPTNMLDHLPLVVLTHGHCCDWLPQGMPDEIDARCEQVWQRLQRKLSGLSSQGRLIVAERSGHRIMLDRPDVVVAAIRDVVEAARDRQHDWRSR